MPSRARKEVGIVLMELSVMDQRYQAVMEVLRDGISVIEVAERYVVARQTVSQLDHQIQERGRGGSCRPIPPSQVVPSPDLQGGGGTDLSDEALAS